MNRAILFFVIALGISNLKAQDSAKINPLSISCYIEAYYCYDLGNPENHERPSFFYSYNRHNEVNLNLGFIKANYSKDKLRANFALMTGTYSQYNLSAEHPIFQHLFEANIGVRISKKANFWIDAGILPSHIGFESAIGNDCWNLTRSILAENSPYFESGVKLGYTSKTDKLYFAAMYLNGWQHIEKVTGNNTPAFGTQLTIKPSDKTTLNWSTFIGNEKPDSMMQWRYFNNLYAQFKLHKKFGVTAGFDIGWEQMKKDTSVYNTWYSPVLILQFKASEKFRIATRVEYYYDDKGVIISTTTPNGFQTLGYSINLDYLPFENVLFRIEGRMLQSKDEIFLMDKKPSKENYFLTTSLAVSF